MAGPSGAEPREDLRRALFAVTALAAAAIAAIAAAICSGFFMGHSFGVGGHRGSPTVSAVSEHAFVHCPEAGVEFKLDRSMKYRQADCPWDDISRFLPSGLWLSDESRGKGWLAFAADNMPGLTEGSVPVSVSVDVSGLLVLRSPKDMPADFIVPVSDSVRERFSDMAGGDVERMLGGARPCWRAVSEFYGGVWVPEHTRGGWHFMEHMWWSMWDCDSAVLWDLDAISEVGTIAA